MDAPGSEDIVSAVRQLRLLGAVSEPDNKLTELGRKMAGFPLQPRLTLAILAGAEEVPAIIALVNVSANGMGAFKVQMCRPMTEEEIRPALSCHIFNIYYRFQVKDDAQSDQFKTRLR